METPMQNEAFWQNVERLFNAEGELKRAEQKAKRMERQQKILTLGIGLSVLTVVFVGAYLVGIGLLYLMPAN